MTALKTLLATALTVGIAHAQPVNDAARAALPDAIRTAGVLKVATALQWPPFDFQGADGTPQGLDIDLVHAIAARLGLTAAFTDVKFPAITPAVSNGRFDIGVDEIDDTPDRRKSVQIVDYYVAGVQLLVRQGGPAIDIGHLCGHTLAVTQGSGQVAMAQKVSSDCTAANQPPIALMFYPASADSYLAVANGRGDGFLTDPAMGVYVSQHNGKLSLQGGTLPGSVQAAGIVVGKDNTALATALRIALKSLAQDGTYQKILTQYGVGDSAVSAKDMDAPPP